MTAARAPLRLQVGARTLMTIPRNLVRIAMTLDAVIAREMPSLPPLGDDADGYLVTSLPESHAIAAPGLIAFVRQRYVRYHTDLTTGFDAWFQAMSANSRSGLKRKAKKLANLGGGAIDVRRYATAAELADFHPLAQAVSALTYQEKLLGSGLPGDAVFLGQMYALAAQDRVRAWLLWLDAKPVAYLWCSAEGQSLRYDHVGHDPAFSGLSPGAVLHLEAMRDLFAERRFARFDFTEGEGQHKRQFASHGTACVDLLLLRPTIANRAAVALVAGFDAVAASAKRLVRHPKLAGVAKWVRQRG